AVRSRFGHAHPERIRALDGPIQPLRRIDVLLWRFAHASRLFFCELIPGQLQTSSAGRSRCGIFFETWKATCNDYFYPREPICGRNPRIGLEFFFLYETILPCSLLVNVAWNARIRTIRDIGTTCSTFCLSRKINARQRRPGNGQLRYDR